MAALAALLAAALLALAAGPAGAGAQTATEQFAFNVIYKNYAIGEHAQTTMLDDSFRAKCRRVKKARVPTAWCWLSWDSDHAHWTAYGRFRGAVTIGPYPYTPFTWRFNVKSRCVGDVCSTVDPKHRVKRRVWKGHGTNAPA